MLAGFFSSFIPCTNKSQPTLLDDFPVFRMTMPSQHKIKALLGKAFKRADSSTAKEEDKKEKKEKETTSQEAQEAISAVAAAAAAPTITTITATTTTTTPSVTPAASASVCVSLPASAPVTTTTTPAPVASASTSAAAVSAASVPAPAPARPHPSPGQQPPPGSVRCGRCRCRYFPDANNSLACYHHPGAVFFRHASQRGYIPSLDIVDRPYDPQAFVWTCCRGVVGQSSGCVYRRHVPVSVRGSAGRGGVSPRMNFRGENAGAFGM
ncbi:hypothetical protein DL771_007527 [Monosporascus sp. 5C6A]|nr:hypothetical protein DL771_007527 [Monosporascus sp. 5C6A]